jgi:hypothetical protein
MSRWMIEGKTHSAYLDRKPVKRLCSIEKALLSYKEGGKSRC